MKFKIENSKNFIRVRKIWRDDDENDWFVNYYIMTPEDKIVETCNNALMYDLPLTSLQQIYLQGPVLPYIKDEKDALEIIDILITAAEHTQPIRSRTQMPDDEEEVWWWSKDEDCWAPGNTLLMDQRDMEDFYEKHPYWLPYISIPDPEVI